MEIKENSTYPVAVGFADFNDTNVLQKTADDLYFGELP